MKVYVLYFNDSEYVDSFDIANRECSVIADPYNAEHIHSETDASYYAERLGCYYKEIEVEEQQMKLFSEETTTIDSCQCVYCGHIFGGRNACNADMDCHTVTCPKCNEDMNVLLSIEYTCTPLEE